MTIKNTTALWRTRPVAVPRKDKKRAPKPKHVFPSGRQALAGAIAHAQLGRNDLIAIPEWSSLCVIAAVGRYAQPVPMDIVLNYACDVSGILVYEQWGWPFRETVLRGLNDRFREKVLLYDAVDSAQINEARLKTWGSSFSSRYAIRSFSKVVGAISGGTVTCDGEYIAFKEDPEAKGFLKKVEGGRGSVLDHWGLDAHVLKTAVATLPRQLVQWLQQSNVEQCYCEELAMRQENMRIVMRNPISCSWPRWMHDAIQDGAGPGIFPAFKGEKLRHLAVLQKNLKRHAGVETAVYHFNWSGNPLKPEYLTCLAVPVHGMVKNIDQILYYLEK